MLEFVVAKVGLLATVTGPVNVIAPPVVTLASTTMELPTTERELAGVPLTVAAKVTDPVEVIVLGPVKLTALGKLKALETVMLFPTEMEPALVKFKFVNETAPPNDSELFLRRLQR